MMFNDKSWKEAVAEIEDSLGITASQRQARNGRQIFRESVVYGRGNKLMLVGTILLLIALTTIPGQIMVSERIFGTIMVLLGIAGLLSLLIAVRQNP